MAQTPPQGSDTYLKSAYQRTVGKFPLMRKKVFTYDRDRGKVVHSERVIVRGGGGNWPLHCEALAVDVSQIEEQKEADRQFGVRPTEYDEIGRPIMTSRAHYKEYQRAQGVVNKSDWI